MMKELIGADIEFQWNSPFSLNRLFHFIALAMEETIYEVPLETIQQISCYRIYSSDGNFAVWVEGVTPEWVDTFAIALARFLGEVRVLLNRKENGEWVCIEDRVVTHLPRE
jgi:hypothetical protein